MTDGSSGTITVHLEVPVPKPMTLNPARTALVIVDMQNASANPAGSRFGSERRGAVVAPIRRLLDSCRQAGAPVIFVQSIRYPDSPEFTYYGRPPFILSGSWEAQIVDELTPLSGEPVVEKNSHDCFNHTRMESLLAEKGIVPCVWTVIVVGLGLTNCVSCAIHGFAMRDYRVAVPADCTASATWEEELCQYHRLMRRTWSCYVTLTRSDLITLSR